MADHVYKVVELVGSSSFGHAEAIEKAITRAAQSLHNLRCFEVMRMRRIQDGFWKRGPGCAV